MLRILQDDILIFHIHDIYRGIPPGICWFSPRGKSNVATRFTLLGKSWNAMEIALGLVNPSHFQSAWWFLKPPL